MGELVLSKRDGSITHITLNRPDQDNLVTNDMLKRLWDSVKEAEPVSNLIILRGTGDNFCSGREIELPNPLTRATSEEAKAQLEAIKQIPSYVAESIRELPNYAKLEPGEFDGQMVAETDRLALNLFDSIRNSSAAIASVVSGRAAGFGCALAALCDITLVSEDADFRVPDPDPNFSNALVLPAVMERLPKTWIDRKATSFLVYGNRKIDARLALELGLASAIIAAESLDDEVDGLARALSSQTRADIKAVKQFIRQASAHPPDRMPGLAAGIAARAAGYALGEGLGEVIGDIVSDE